MTYVTPEQARDKFCPMKLAISPEVLSDRGCHGLACMMWRVIDGLGARRGWKELPWIGNGSEPDIRPSTVPPSWVWHADEDARVCGWAEPEGELMRRVPGRCGLASERS